MIHASLTTAALAMNAAGYQEYELWWLAPATLGLWLFFKQNPDTATDGTTFCSVAC